MTLNQRIEAFGHLAAAIHSKKWQPDFETINARNPWFTPENLRLALKGILRYLDEVKLKSWYGSYHSVNHREKTVGLIMAGNIPLVGFHDLICVLISGHKALVKLSHQDNLILPSLIKAWAEKSKLAEQVEFVENWELPLDALIATGSDNTARYVSYQFPSTPKIIRGNRTSHAVIRGDEELKALKLLGTDMFSFFGRGCRNVTKLWVPTGYNFEGLAKANKGYSHLVQNYHYQNNLLYQKALLSTLSERFLDLGYTFLIENTGSVSPLGVIYYQYYQNHSTLKQQLDRQMNKIQCLVSHEGWYTGSIDMGTAQFPELPDYADNMDTMAFLKNLD